MAVLLNEGEVDMISFRISKRLSQSLIQTTSPSLSLISSLVSSLSLLTTAFASSIMDVTHIR